jgi:hypothetical protein
MCRGRMYTYGGHRIRSILVVKTPSGCTSSELEFFISPRDNQRPCRVSGRGPISLGTRPETGSVGKPSAALHSSHGGRIGCGGSVGATAGYSAVRIVALDVHGGALSELTARPNSYLDVGKHHACNRSKQMASSAKLNRCDSGHKMVVIFEATPLASCCVLFAANKAARSAKTTIVVLRNNEARGLILVTVLPFNRDPRTSN